MSVAEFSAWALILQLAAYVNYLDLGIQVALARWTAHTHERKDLQRRNEVVTSGVIILAVSAGVALFIAGILTWQLPRIYPSIPPVLLPQVRMGLFFVAGALALALPGSTYTGVLVGLNKSDMAGLLVAVTRILAGAGVIVLARIGAPLSILAAFLGFFYLLNALLQVWMAHKHCPGLVVSSKFISRLQIKAVAADCAYLSAWNLGMFLVSGLDIALVGRFSFRDLGAYSVASTLVLFVAGINGAIFASMLAPIAALHANRELEKIGRLVLKSTRIGIYITALTCLPLLFAGKIILAYWVTPAYARTAWPILLVLVIANMIRLAATPYSVAVLGTGQQKLIVLSPLIEGVVNLLFSIVLGMRMGAMGVAVGTLIGAAVGLAAVTMFFVQRTKEIRVTQWQYAWDGIMVAIFAVLPGLACLWLLYFQGLSFTNAGIGAIGLVVSSLLCRRSMQPT